MEFVYFDFVGHAFKETRKLSLVCDSKAIKNVISE